MLTRLAVCGAMAALRLLELRQSRRNTALHGHVREGRLARATYPGIVALHTATIALTFLRGGRVRPLWLALLLAVQPIRFWVLATLGDRWNARGAVPADLDVEAGGPYRYVRHPNYAVVGVELLTLPLAFGLWRVAALAMLANACLLAIRIRDEEALLFEAEGYREAFEHRARFIPGVF